MIPVCACGNTDVYECGHCSGPVCAYCAAVWEDDESVCRRCERRAREDYLVSCEIAREDERRWA